MTTRAIRVTVRGAFAGLDERQRAELLAAAPDHDLSHASYTPEGHLSYDIAARPFFTFRFLTSAEDEAGIPDAAARAELSAEEWLTARGYGFKGVSSTAVDVSQAPLGARPRTMTRLARSPGSGRPGCGRRRDTTGRPACSARNLRRRRAAPRSRRRWKR